MKRINFYVLFVVSSCLYGCMGNNAETSLDKDGLHGPVASVLTLQYEGINKFGEGEIVKGDPSVIGSSYKQYDSTGFITASKEYLIFDNEKEFEHVFDGKGREIKWTSYDDGKVKYSKEYEYDEHGNKCLERDLGDHEVTHLKNTYDDNGHLLSVSKGWSSTSYEYDDQGRLVKETEHFRYIGDFIDEYVYDDQGNIIERIYTSDRDKSYYFNKFDDKNRRISYIECSSDDPSTGKVLRKISYFYKDEYATIPYMVKKWDEDGKLTDTTYDVYIVNQTDTLSNVELDKDMNLSYLVVYSHKGVNSISVGYSIESDLLNDNTYNYLDGKLASVTDNSSGNLTSYSYKGNEITSVISELNKGKIVSSYKKGRVVSVITYDQHNKPESSTYYEYRGNIRNGSETAVSKGKDNNEEKYVSIYEDGNLVSIERTVNGLTVIEKYSYDDHGNIASVSSSDGSDVRYAYVYDYNGNWVSMTCTRGDEVTITERKIDYFPLASSR